MPAMVFGDKEGGRPSQLPTSEREATLIWRFFFNIQQMSWLAVSNSDISSAVSAQAENLNITLQDSAADQSQVAVQ